MKRTMVLLLALAMVMCALPAFSSAEGEMTTLKILGYERNISDNTFFADRAEYVVWQAAEKMWNDAGLNLEFEIIADSDQYKTTIQTRLAAAHDLPDLCYIDQLSSTEVLNLADLGIILPMNKVLESTKGAAYDYFYEGEGLRARNSLSDADGNFYWLPRIQINQLDGVERGTSMGVCIRLDWLNKLGLEVPNSLESFKAALKAFQDNDMNGNGIVDEVATLDTSTFGNGINYWFGMVNGYVGVNVTDGTVESPWYSPVAKEYFTYVQELVNEGLLYADKIGSDTSTSQLQNENKVSALYYYPVGTYVESPIRTAGFEDCYYIGIEPFNAVEGVTGFYSEETPYLVYMKFGVTNAAADKIEAAATYYDVIYSEDFLKLMDYGVEGSMYEVVDGKYVRLTSKLSFNEGAEQRVSTIDWLARFFLPTVYHNERLDELQNKIDGGWQEKADFELATADYEYKTPNDNSGYYALPTAEENEVFDTYTTDLETYSRELAANLSLGRASLDDWDSYIAELKALGLDEVIAARQAELDRRNGK